MKSSSKRCAAWDCSLLSSKSRAKTPWPRSSPVEAQDTSTILIVEDDPGIAELEKLRLEDVGYRIVLAATAGEAIRKIRSESVDLIVLDYRLPGDVDGLRFFSQVRAAGFDLPVILVTGFSSEATVIRALRAGVRDFVTKSV